MLFREQTLLAIYVFIYEKTKPALTFQAVAAAAADAITTVKRW